ncbi:MAG: DUF1569 domain-containing protein [Flavobacterium sp.]
MSNTAKIKNQVSLLQDKLKERELVNSEISKASVGWHIEHSLAVLDQIMNELVGSNPSGYHYQFNFWKTIIFLRGQIPRGKAKAPKAVRVEQPNSSEDFLLDLIQKVKDKITMVETLPKNSFFVHPFFGKMNVKESKRMMYLHTDHHLKIIEDILKHKKSR